MSSEAGALPQIPYKHVRIIINPASGQDRPILNTLNTIFKDSGVDWNVAITKEAGDASRLAREALEAGADAVAAYGGDGTVREVASALVGSQVPLVVLPGGTANALAVTLGIPVDLAQAGALLSSGKGVPRAFDVGKVGDLNFLVAVGIGIPGALAETADRDAKDRLGLLAYLVQSVKATQQVDVAHYHLTLDDEQIDAEGVACVIANASNFGIPGLPLANGIVMDDGLLDVLMIRAADLPTLVSLAASMVLKNEDVAPFQHWQAHHVRVVSEPAQPVQVDGEVSLAEPVDATVLPAALRILVPV